MKRERIDRWTRMRHTRARFSGSDTSSRMRCSAAFITSIAESSSRYTQLWNNHTRCLCLVVDKRTRRAQCQKWPISPTVRSSCQSRQHHASAAVSQAETHTSYARSHCRQGCGADQTAAPCPSVRDANSRHHVFQRSIRCLRLRLFGTRYPTYGNRRLAKLAHRCTKAATHVRWPVGVPLPRKPMVGSFPGCCARAASGHAATAPPISVMNSRLFTRSPRR